MKFRLNRTLTSLKTTLMLNFDVTGTDRQTDERTDEQWDRYRM